MRISVKIIDVREAYFRVATDADLARSVTGRGGGGDFADWTTCLPAKSFKHDQLLYVVSTHLFFKRKYAIGPAWHSTAQQDTVYRRHNHSPVTVLRFDA